MNVGCARPRRPRPAARALGAVSGLVLMACATADVCGECAAEYAQAQPCSHYEASRVACLAVPCPIAGEKSADSWQGPCKDKKPDGKGVFVAASGDRYEGEMKQGLRAGAGTYTWSNGEQYTGTWREDQRDGEGVHTWPSGAKYTGSFKGNKRHGKGKLVWGEDHSYEGDWADGERSGQGTFHWPDGEKYVGGFKSGGRSGKGVNERPDGQRYEVSVLPDHTSLAFASPSHLPFRADTDGEHASVVG
jgi:hypothetical protein